jgi:DNA-binding SARP family transcriptional activator/predicted ATPase
MMYIQLLGGFRLQSGEGTAITLTVPRLQSLAAYLVLHRETPQFRRHLSFLFWPDSGESQARTNLRGELHRLKLALPDAEAYLDFQPQWVQWRPDAALTLDVTEFERLVALADGAVQAQQPAGAITALEQAVALYRGPLLPACYDEWILPLRERLEQRFTHALDSLVGLLEISGEYAAAIRYAQRRLQQDRLHEQTYHDLMRLYALHGDRAGALRAYHECVALLKRELGVAPGAELRAAYAQLMNEDVAQTLSAPQPVHGGNPSVLVGRQPEWQQLLLAWQRASQGRAQMVSIAGEAGIGKTRLAGELAGWVRRHGAQVATAYCYEEGNLAFSPLVELLRKEPLRSTLADLEEVWLAQVARLLPELAQRRPTMTLSGPVSDPLQRQHFFEALARAVLAGGRPLLLVIEDLHWCDRETLEWLVYFVRFAAQARLLLVVTVRSEALTADHLLLGLMLRLRRKHSLVEIDLDRLSAADTAALAAQIAGRALAPDEAAELYRHTEGNPLFVVEMVRARAAGDANGQTLSGVVGRGGAAAPANDLPEGIRTVIQARLAQLSPAAQDVAQLAAAAGRAFSLELLAKAGGYAEDALLHSLDELWQRHIVQEQGASAYDFSHNKIREVAYGEISPLRRRLLHRRLAHALEALNPQSLDEVSSQIALHYELGDKADQAVPFYQRAAHFALRAWALQDAVDFARKAKELLATTPDSAERRRQELDLQLDLGRTLQMLKGASHPETQQAYSHVLTLSQGAGSDNGETELQLFDAMWGLRSSYLLQAESARAIEASQFCWRMASRAGDPELLLQAHHAFWEPYIHFCVGPAGLQSAVDHARQGIALYRPEWHRSHVVRYGGHDPGVCAHNALANAQWLMGYPDQAVDTASSAIRLARQLGHSFSLVMALTGMARVHWYRREPSLALELLDQLRSILAGGSISTDELSLRGWATGQLKPSTEAVALIRQTLSIWQDRGRKLELPALLALLAETYAQVGDMASARQAIGEALEIAHATGEDYYRPELHRLWGSFMLAAGEKAAAQVSFQQALKIAQAQGTKSLELRAATSLGQLLAEQGRRGEAHELLAGVYHWFTEGFDTADLRQAQDLLLTL